MQLVMFSKASLPGTGAPPDASSSESSVSARLGEVAEILATGLQRAHARKSSGLSPGERDFSVEPLARQSGGVATIEGDTT
jgi:hypothetical protein